MTSATKINEFKMYDDRAMKIKKDPRLFISHSSLYSALFICFQQNGGISPFPISRRMLMSYSNIASTATYHKCINKLVDLGYIVYSPSYHPVKGSMIEWPVTP